MSKIGLSTEHRQADGDLIGRARAFAIRAHGAQIRKYSKQPYIVHLDAVVRILQSFGITAPPVLAAAYLHDAVEDTDVTIEEILKAFGEEVAELVYWLTDAEKGKRRIRKLMSAWRLGRAPFEAKLIKLADFIDNSQDICRHDRHFAPVYLREKAKILALMARSEGERLTGLPIFVDASRITCLEDARPITTRVHRE
jgi:GTP diphosphokinase / guanosine-3',5'-bis(diphosphate) 3'-diphosphatase